MVNHSIYGLHNPHLGHTIFTLNRYLSGKLDLTIIYISNFSIDKNNIRRKSKKFRHLKFKNYKRLYIHDLFWNIFSFLVKFFIKVVLVLSDFFILLGVRSAASQKILYKL